jgi:hypothetical protein
MRLKVLGWVILVAAILAWPTTGYTQQEATLIGTVTDSSGGVLPGVMVRAVHQASGNTYEAVTDDRGGYRILLRIGAYQVTAELEGFAASTRRVELLVGQEASVNLEMAPSAIEESVVVTGQAPLIEPTRSDLGGNVDPRQMEGLPVTGRNWQDLVMLAPGSTVIGGTGLPVARNRTDYQLNMDGAQVTSIVGPGGQPKFSLDAVAEFQFLSGRFDATQGRASNVALVAVSKSGTNTFSGSVGGYFRDDRFNAADFVAKRVLTDKNRQASFTFGGPIRRDRIHFFGNYEYERIPSTIVYTSPYPSFNIDLENNRWQHNFGGRFDMQITSRARLMVRGTGWTEINPHTVEGGATNHPSTQGSVRDHSESLYGSWTQVMGNRAVNELRVGYTRIYTNPKPVVAWRDHPNPVESGGLGTPRIALRGYTIGHTNTNWPFKLQQTALPFFKNDFAYSAGSHQLKLGGEYHPLSYWLLNCRNCAGVYDAQGTGAPNPPANLEALFPVWNDPTTWNLNALNPIIRTYQIGVGNFRGDVPRKLFSAWIQDDWRLTRKLTLNLGLRYDVELDAWANHVEVQTLGPRPLLEANRPNDTNNFGPRLGFAYAMTDRTAVRGGWGAYYGTINNTQGSFTNSAKDVFIVQVNNDGRPDFATNPFNGPAPTFEQLEARWAAGENVPRTSAGGLAAPDMRQPVSYHGSIGFERQVGPSMAVEADFVVKLGRNESYTDDNVNLTYDPVTGVNYRFTDLSRRPISGWQRVQMLNMNGTSDYRALQTGFTKRFSNRWQASATYTLGRLRDCDPLPRSGWEIVTFPVAPDLGGECSLATTDQRHRAVLNGIWELGYGFQVSGLLYAASGQRYATSYGGDLRNRGVTTAGRLRPDGTIVPRNNFVGDPIRRMDMRIQKRFSLGGRAAVDAALDVFNVFNNANYGSYTTQESNTNYGRPSQNSLAAYAPRTVQLGFKMTF